MKRNRFLGHLAGAVGLLSVSPAWAAFGDTDTTFGPQATPGFAIHDLGGNADTGIDLVTGADDALFALGLTCNTGSCAATNKLVVSRYDADGHLDTEFGTNGDLTVQTNVANGNYRLEVDDHNKRIYLASVFCDATQCLVTVVRKKFDGTVDTTYGNAGTAAFSVAGNPVVQQLLLLNSGKLLLMLERDTLNASNAVTATRFTIVRLNMNGAIDTSWGTNGAVDASTVGGCDLGPSMMIGRNPVVYVTAAKASSCAGPYVPVVRRFTATGDRDATFGNNGEVASNFGQTGDVVALVAQEQPDGKIGYGIGAFNNSHGFNIDLLKLTSTGLQDASFTPQHGTYTPISNFVPNGNAPFQSTGKLVFNGFWQPNGSTATDEALTRLQGSPLLAHPVRFGADFGLPFVGFADASKEVSEGAGTTTVTIVLTDATDHDVTVPFTLGGSAAEGLDYSVSSHVFTIHAGSTSGSVTVTLLNDDIEEFGESILFDLDTPTGAQPTTLHNTFIVAIDDNDLNEQPPPETGDGGAIEIELLAGLFGLLGLRRVRGALRRR